MAENNFLLTATILILAVALFSPSLTGNYQYGNQCGSPGETFCDSTSRQFQGTYHVCVYDEKLGRNVWAVNANTGDTSFSCTQGQTCINAQSSYGVNEAKCIWPHLPKQY